MNNKEIYKNFIGTIFNRLTVISFNHTGKWREKYYNCICVCGKECVVRGYVLINGKTKSCGCLQKEHALRHVKRIAEERRANPKIKKDLYLQEVNNSNLTFKFDSNQDPHEKMFIYKITNLINGKIYIGKSTISFKYLLGRYKRKHGPRRPIKSAIEKYGLNNFIIDIIDKAETESELNTKEIDWIEKMCTRNPHKGYNITRGGEGVCGVKRTIKQIETIRAIGKQNKGPLNPFYRKTHTKEVVQKIIESNKRRKGGTHAPLSKETKDKIRLIR